MRLASRLKPAPYRESPACGYGGSWASPPADGIRRSLRAIMYPQLQSVPPARPPLRRCRGGGCGGDDADDVIGRRCRTDIFHPVQIVRAVEENRAGAATTRDPADRGFHQAFLDDHDLLVGVVM